MRTGEGIGAARYFTGVAFAAMVFGAGFYGIVLYEFALDDLTKGALISLMTLAAQFVFGEALASAVGRRAQANFEAGTKSQFDPVTGRPMSEKPTDPVTGRPSDEHQVGDKG